MTETPEIGSSAIPEPEKNPIATELSAFRQKVQEEMKKVIVGQDALTEQLLITLLCNGHALLEGVPGVAKTLISKTLARILDVEFRRIQFTPDLMPSDIVGTKVFDFSTSSFKTQKGPVFTHFVLIDEVNRAPAKTQSALLEVMEERQVTLEGETFPLEDPFLVLATQNPVEFEGTYPLPEAQMDRFIMKITVGYPGEEEELEVLRRFHTGELKLGKSAGGVQKVISKNELGRLRGLVEQVVVEPGTLQYINRIVRATRSHPFIFLGSSPRGNISLLLASKAHAALQGRDYVNPDDVKAMVAPVLRHRILLSPEAEIEGLSPDQVLKEIAGRSEVPR